MKTTLFLKPGSPCESIVIENERILCNDVHLPCDHRHPHNMRLWVIGNVYGACGAVWASHEQDAIDELIDQGLAGGILIDEEDVAKMTPEEQDEIARGGNAGEPYDTEYLWMSEVAWKPERDWQLIARFAEARGAGAKSLDDI